MPGDYFSRQRGELIRYNELTYLFMRRTYYLKKKCSEKPTTTNVKPATMKAPVACRLPMTASTSWILMRAGILSYTTQDQPIEDVKDMRTITISFVRYLCMCTLPTVPTRTVSADLPSAPLPRSLSCPNPLSAVPSTTCGRKDYWKPSSVTAPKVARAACSISSGANRKTHLPPRGYYAHLVEGATCHGDRRKNYPL